MNENLQILGIFGQLGMGGIMLTVAFAIWNKAEARMKEQQDRDDARWSKIRAQDKVILDHAMSSMDRQGQHTLECAKLVQRAAEDIRVATERLSCPNRGGGA